MTPPVARPRSPPTFHTAPLPHLRPAVPVSLLQVLAKIADQCPDLKHVVTITEEIGEAEASKLKAAGITTTALKAVEEKGAANRLPPQAGPSSDVAVLMYTSGTTGLPKGVRLSHGNVAALVAATRAPPPAPRRRPLPPRPAAPTARRPRATPLTRSPHPPPRSLADGRGALRAQPVHDDRGPRHVPLLPAARPHHGARRRGHAPLRRLLPRLRLAEDAPRHLARPQTDRAAAGAQLGAILGAILGARNSRRAIRRAIL